MTGQELLVAWTERGRGKGQASEKVCHVAEVCVFVQAGEGIETGRWSLNNQPDPI